MNSHRVARISARRRVMVSSEALGVHRGQIIAKGKFAGAACPSKCSRSKCALVRSASRDEPAIQRGKPYVCLSCEFPENLDPAAISKNIRRFTRTLRSLRHRMHAFLVHSIANVAQAIFVKTMVNCCKKKTLRLMVIVMFHCAVRKGPLPPAKNLSPKR